MTVLAPEAQRQIDEASAALAAAQADLELVMGQVTGVIRADKMMISEKLRSALDRLAGARERLRALVDR